MMTIAEVFKKDASTHLFLYMIDCLQTRAYFLKLFGVFREGEISAIKTSLKVMKLETHNV